MAKFAKPREDTSKSNESKLKVHTQYFDSQGNRLPSVTTVIGVLDKPALVHWAWKCGIEGLDYKKVRDKYGGIGTLTHYLILCHFKGVPPELDEYSRNDITAATTCLKAFYDWEKKHKIEPLYVEHSLTSDKLKFGGTLDMYCKLDKVPTLIDFKTSSAIREEYIIQVAAYDTLLRECKKVNPQQWIILRIGRIPEEGFEDKTLNNVQIGAGWNMFEACIKVYENKKLVKL